MKILTTYLQGVLTAVGGDHACQRDSRRCTDALMTQLSHTLSIRSSLQSTLWAQCDRLRMVHLVRVLAADH